jgi:hypothetical protein
MRSDAAPALDETFSYTLTGNTTLNPASGLPLVVQIAGVNRFQVNGTTTSIQGQGPTAAALVDMTPDRGTFTLTGTGFTVAPTSTATWYRIGNVVLLNVGALQGTSNATTLTATGLPAAIQPSLAQTVPSCDMEDNGAVLPNSSASFAAGSGTSTFNPTQAASGSWTNSGVKGFRNTGGTTLVYLLK